MPPLGPIKILFYYFLIYIKLVYSNDGSSELGVDNSLGTNIKSLTHSQKPKTGTHEPSLKQALPLLDQSKIKIILPDSSDESKSVECTCSKYTIETEDRVMMTYKLKEGVKCVEVRYDGKEAWKRDPSITKEYPKCVHFLKDGPVVVEMNENLFFFSIRRSNSDWESVTMGKFGFKSTDVILKKFDSKFDPVAIETNEFDQTNHRFFLEYRFKPDVKCDTVNIKSEYPWMYNEAIYGEYPSVIYVFPNRILSVCAGKAFIQRLDINNPDIFYMPREIIRPALAGYMFEKRDGCLFYDFADKCVGVNYDDKEVWKYNSTKPNSPYPESVMFAIRGKTAIVKFGDFLDTRRLTDNGWKTIYYGVPEPVFLDVSTKLNTDHFDYKKSGKVHTYTQRGKYMFNIVVRSVGLILPDDEKILKAKHSSGYATKVVYDESDSKRKVVTIHQLNGCIRTFEKLPECEWYESVRTYSDTELTADKVQILT